MDYVNPQALMQETVVVAKKKSTLTISDMLIRGMLSGVFLGFGTSMAIIVTAQGLPPVVGAIMFPAGFVILVLLGLELATGNFAVLPAGLMAGEVSFMKLLRNWTWVYFGNLLGCVFYAFLFYLTVTNFGATSSGPVGEMLKAAAQKKTLAYMALGYKGWASAMTKGILCNWMVTIGALFMLVSRSTIGKIVAMWLPITVFFAQGFEHSVVNMFVIPAGMLFGAPISIRNWFFWNQIPVTIGNIVAGVFFTAAALYLTYGAKQSVSNETAAEKEIAPLEGEVSFAQATAVTQ
ncbi:MAG TPA: formate/nitrite transporter family protein [Terriglobales bacterium]|nr:formate/nitrite transporter family protein [Terriglobales bacterium]